MSLEWVILFGWAERTTVLVDRIAWGLSGAGKVEPLYRSKLRYLHLVWSFWPLPTRGS